MVRCPRHGEDRDEADVAVGRARRHADLREALRGEQPVKPIVICAWCPTFDPADPINAVATHGICEPCRVKFEAGASA
jgi:hypothetical protein